MPLLAQLITSGGLPLIARVLGSVLSKKDGALKEAGDLLLANSGEVQTQLSSKDNVRLALAELENQRADTEGNYELLVEQQKTQRQELASSSWLARSWRPIFGLALALTWTIQMLAMTAAIIFQPELASDIVSSFGALTAMWIMGFGAVGVSVNARTRDKRMQAHNDAGTTPPPSLAATLLSRFKG